MASTFRPPVPMDCNAVFIDTNLDTHFVTFVYSTETVFDLQKRVLIEHVKRFPRLGDIKIDCLKVKRRGKFYHLSDSIPVKSLFHWVTKDWFISVDASSSASTSDQEQINETLIPESTKHLAIPQKSGFAAPPETVAADPSSIPSNLEFGTRDKEEGGQKEESNTNGKRGLKNDDVSLGISLKKHRKVSFQEIDDVRPTQIIKNSSSTRVNQDHSQQQKSLVGVSELLADNEDQNDDFCLMCGDCGDLICCDSCPSSFHQNCIGIETVPEGLWHCKYCFCKICHERVSSDHSTCSSCDQKYHPSCTNCTLANYCGDECRNFRDKLDNLIGEEHTLEGESYTWRFVRREFDENDDDDDESNEMRLELKGASKILKYCFRPMVDKSSGKRINLIDQMVYNRGSKWKRLDYSSFFTAILETKDHEIRAAATIRIHGNKLAEMPLVGTDGAHRGDGLCRKLLTGIECGLRYLNVKKLVIPAVDNTDKKIWIPKLGFKVVSENRIKKLLKKYNMYVCHEAIILSKSLKEKAQKERS